MKRSGTAAVLTILLPCRYTKEQVYILLSCCPCEGRISGIVDVPNACATLAVPVAIFDQDIRPNKGGPPVGPKLVVRGSLPQCCYSAQTGGRTVNAQILYLTLLAKICDLTHHSFARTQWARICPSSAQLCPACRKLAPRACSSWSRRAALAALLGRRHCGGCTWRQRREGRGRRRRCR